MNELQEKQAKREQLTGQLTALLSKEGKDKTSPENLTAIRAKNTEIEAIDVEIKDLREVQDIMTKNAQRQADAGTIDPADRPANYGKAADGGSVDPGFFDKIHVPAMSKGYTPQALLRATGGDRQEAQKVAYALGQFLLGSVLGRKDAQDWCAKNGMTITRAQAENNNAAGGFLVPIVLANYIISLMEEFGVVRGLMHKVKMTSDTLNVPRRAGSLRAYFLTDNQAIAASQKNIDQVSLTAKKLAALALFSNELAEDAVINIGDDLSAEIAFQFSVVEDECGLLGDGTSPYGGIVGVGPAILKAFGGAAGAGLIVGTAGSGGAFTGYHLTDFNRLQGALPRFAWKRGKPVFICTQQFYYNVMVELAAAAGGNTITSINEGAKGEPMFLGCPVVFSQVMPTQPAVNTIDCYFGDLGLAAEFGDRRSLTLAMSSEYGFASDSLAIRGIERFDINVHDVGGSNAASQAINPSYPQDGTTAVAGPVVALMSASS